MAKVLAYLIVSVFLLFPGIANSLVRRHDVDDQKLLSLGAEFDAVGTVGGLADGTLIAPQWVLTAGHVARGAARRGRLTFSTATETVPVRAVFVHPNFSGPGAFDLGLLQLERPIETVKPIPLMVGQDVDLQGLELVLVGHGRHGVGNDPARLEDGQRRAGSNLVESVFADSLRFLFDAPGTQNITRLEVIPGPGDSGGPALLRLGDRYVVVAVSSAGSPGARGPGSYGALDTFARVESSRKWMDSVIAGSEEALNLAEQPDSGTRVVERAAVTGPANDVDLEGHPAGRQLLALLSVLVESESDLDEFVANRFGEGSRERRVDALSRLRTGFSGATLAGVARLEPRQVDAILNAPSGQLLLGVRIDEAGLIEAVFDGRP